MSDFVTELRREVVTAHAQHRVAAVRTRRRRRRPILAGAIALAALLVAVVWAVRSIPPPEQSTEPRVVKVVRIGGSPGDGVFAYGSLWVSEFEGRRIVRVDPDRRKVIGQVELDEGPNNIDAGAGSLWARGLLIEPDTRVWRIDPGSERVVDEVDHPDVFGPIAAGAEGAWVADDNGSILRISASGGPDRHIPFGVGSGLAAAGRWVWAVSQDGTVARIDARSARIVHQWRHVAPTAGSEAIVADPRGAWLLSPGQGRILRLEGDRVTRVIRVDDSVAPILARTGAGLWIVTSDEPPEARLARIDPRTGHVTATVELGAHYPRALVPARGGLWVISGDGTALLVDTK